MLDFIKDIFSSLRQSSLERIKSPFLGAFVFSWFGFNWQLLAVLALSEKDILARLDYINDNFDTGKLLVAPTFTTILICIILPNANKLVTKLQRKTNHETNEIILQSKIDIAEKQLQLADFEAKKKLSEEREKKNIDTDISTIISTLDKTNEELDQSKSKCLEQEKLNVTLLASEQNLKSKIIEVEAQIKISIEENIALKNKIEQQVKEYRNELKSHDKTKGELSKVIEESIKSALNLNEVTDEKIKLTGEVKALKEQIEFLKDDINRIIKDSTKIYSNNKFIDNTIRFKNESLTQQPLWKNGSELDQELIKKIKSLSNDEMLSFLKDISTASKQNLTNNSPPSNKKDKNEEG